MLKDTDLQRTQQAFCKIDDYLATWLEAFLIERKARGVSDGTLHYYRMKLRGFSDYCDNHALTNIHQLTPTFIRRYILWLEEQGHNPGGQHAHYRAIRAFLRWFENEVEPDDWKNPIAKVKAPKVPDEPLEPVSFDVVTKMLNACPRDTFTGDRDAAILLCLLDTGARAGEFLAVNLEDVNQARGDILIRRGKGGKPRSVFLGKKSRRQMRRYLKCRRDESPALWVTHPRFGSERLTYDGLRSVLKRRADFAKVDAPTPHDFRRAFALSMLRQGVDIFTLAKLMGHADITVLRRYLRQTKDDTEAAHRQHGPVDNKM